MSDRERRKCYSRLDNCLTDQLLACGNAHAAERPRVLVYASALKLKSQPSHYKPLIPQPPHCKSLIPQHAAVFEQHRDAMPGRGLPARSAASASHASPRRGYPARASAA